jgi:hypothetical protein
MNIYLDANISEYVAEALNQLNKGHFTQVNVFSTKHKFGKSATDEEIIPVLGKQSDFLITFDLNIKRRPMQFALCKQYKLGIVFLSLPKGMTRHWEIVKLLVNHWEELIKELEKSKPPFSIELKIKGKIKVERL